MGLGGSPFPADTVGCFRTDLFFSFFGRIVSVLGFVRRLVLDPCTPVGGTRGAWGIDVTVSVSTVMLCSDGSPALPFADLMAVVDCLLDKGGAAGARPLRSALMLPLSLPLSFEAWAFPAGFLDSARSTDSAWDASETMLSSAFSSSDSPGRRGDPTGLASCTVSRVDELPPPPRAGVLMPAGGWASSGSVSEGQSAGDGCGGVARCTLISGGASPSGRRGGPELGLWRRGGGDRSLGETGHRGDSRRCSMEVGDLTGAPTFELGSGTDGGSVGVLEDDRVVVVLEGGAGGGLFCLADRVGLRSCRLPLRERMPAFAGEAREVVVRDSGLAGDGSREGSGDGAADDDVDAAEACDADLDGAGSGLGGTAAVMVLADDARDGAGWARRLLLGPSEGDLSMTACVQWDWLERDDLTGGSNSATHAAPSRRTSQDRTSGEGRGGWWMDGKGYG